jgi:elongation factor G
VNALVPMATMIGYSNSIRNRTKGKGVFTMEFAQNEAVPKSVADEIIAARGMTKAD